MRWEGGEEIGRPFQDLLPELAIGLGISLAAFYITFEIMVNGLSGLVQILTTEPIISFFLLSVVSLFFLIGYLLRIQIRHETEIRAISDYYERALDSTEQGLAIIDRDFRIKFQNRIALLSIGDATGGRCYEIYFERDKPCEDCRLEEVIGRRRCFRYLREHQDGRIFEVTLAPFEDKDGSTVVLETMKDVTEREYAEAKLREAALILKTMAEGVVITDAHGRIRDMNDRVLTLSGYSREELAGEKLESFFHEDDRKKLTSLLDSVISGRESESSELRMSCKDGRELTLSVNLSPLEGNSNPGSAIVTLHDITPLKMAEQELMEQVILADQLNTELAIQNEELMVAQEMLEASERRFRTLVEHAPDMIQLIDENGTILQVNPATVSCTGYSEEELLGQPLTMLLTDESKEIFYTEFLWLKEEGVHRAEIGFLSKGGRVIDLDCHCASTGDGCFVLIQRDITERKRMEEELERSRNELQRYLDHILTFNGMLDPDGTLKMANRTAVDSTGLPYDEIIGKHFADIYWWSYDPMVQDRLRANIRRAASGETVVWEERVRVKDGFIITQLTLRPVFDENGENIRYIVAEGQDITRIKEAERKIRWAHDLINSISNFAGIADREGRLQLVNRRTLEALGFREEEVLGELFWECGWFTHSNDVVETVKASIKAALRGEMGRKELTVSTKDGREIPVYFTSTPMLDPGGEVVGIALEGVDITELKEREGALRSSEARYRELISRMNEGFCAIDENGYLTFVNPRLCEMLEYSEDELIGMDIRDLLDEENRQILERELEKRGRGESSRYELTWTARSGKKIPALMSASPIPAKGVYKGSYAVITDLSRIREAEELYRTIIDAASDAREGFALVQDIGGIEAKHVYVNDYYCELTGYTRDELYQMSAFELIPDDIKDEVHDRYIRKMRGENLPRYHEFEWMNRNGEKFTVGLSSAVAAYRGRPAFLYYFRDVTEEKRMREEIKQKSVFLESILKSMSDMVAIIDLDGRITAVNHAVEEELGFRMDEVIGLGFNEAGWFDESLRDEIGLFLGRVAEGEVIEDREITIFTEDGQPIQILFSMVPILDRSSGEVLGIIAQGTDISELKEAHEALKARAKEIEEYTDELLTQKEQLIVMTAELETAKTYLEILIDTIPSALFTVNTEKKITFWNRACEDITGYTREEVLGESCSIIKGNCCDGYCALFDDDVVKPVRGRECSIRSKDGREIIISKNLNLLYDASSKITGGIESFIDVTAEREAMRTIKESEEKYRTLVENINVGVFRVSPDGRFIEANPGFIRIIGGSNRDNVLGSRVKDLFLTKEMLKRVMEELEKEGEIKDYEIPLRRFDHGSVIWVSLTAQLLEHDGEKYIDGIIEDISARRELERRMKYYTEELEHKIRMATAEIRHDKMKLAKAYKDLKELDRLKMEFFSNVSHELKTPLTVIKAHLHFLKSGKLGEITDEMRHSIDVALEEATDLEELVGRILDLSRLDAGRLELNLKMASLKDIVADLVERMRKTAEEEGQKLILEVEDEIPKRLLDPRRMKEVVRNLISNAIKYNPEGTTITIKIYRNSENIILDVTDDGVGIEEDKLEKIFERFYQVDGSSTRSGSGTGIGLSIVKELVELHGGKVTVESEVGLGSTFRVILPIKWDETKGGE